MAFRLLTQPLPMRAAFAALLFSTAAAAQTTYVSIDVAGSNKATVGSGDCDATVPVTWRAGVPVGTFSCKDLDIWVTDQDCGDNYPASADVAHYKQYGPFSTSLYTPAGSGSVLVAVKDLPGLNASTTDGGITCGTQGVTRSYKVCAAFTLGGSFGCSSSPTVVRASAVTINYDAQPPAAPSIDAVSAQDSALSLALTVSSDVSQVHLYVRGPGEAEFSIADSIAAAITTPKIGGLTNGTTYELQAVAEDAAGNLSPASNIASGTPVKTRGFFGAYRLSGGHEQGGCGAAPGLLLLPLAAFALRRTRRK
jgi:hypothetical protein